MNTIPLTFLGVQPIHIKSDLYIKLITKKANLQKLDEISTVNSLKWLDQFIHNYDVYKDLYEIPISKIHADLQKDFYRSFHPLNSKNEVLPLSKYLKKESIKLYYDPRFVYFIAIYVIDFEIPLNVLDQFLDYKPDENNTNKKDLYNVIRGVFVKDDQSQQLGMWGNEAHEHILTEVKNTLKAIYPIELKKDDVSIPNSTCNISNIVFAKEHINNKEFVKKFINLNIYAERLTSNYQIMPLYNNTVYFSFHGRFHTIILKNESDMYRFQPLQFHIQYMWFLIERYNKIMSGINRKLIEVDSKTHLQKYILVIHTMINKIEFLHLHDMNFKHAIEVDINIYEKHEKQWSVSVLLEAAKQYVSFFKDYLERLYNQKNALFQKRLNFILIAISFMQLLALISVWNDYLSIINQGNLKVDPRVVHMFDFFDGKVSGLLNFNLYIPIGLFAVFIVIIGYLWKSNREI